MKTILDVQRRKRARGMVILVGLFLIVAGTAVAMLYEGSAVGAWCALLGAVGLLGGMTAIRDS